MQIGISQTKIISAVILLTTLMTWFYYAHETFTKPVRAVTALFAAPVAIASGLSHYLKLGVDVYETFGGYSFQSDWLDLTCILSRQII